MNAEEVLASIVVGDYMNNNILFEILKNNSIDGLDLDLTFDKCCPIIILTYKGKTASLQYCHGAPISVNHKELTEEEHENFKCKSLLELLNAR